MSDPCEVRGLERAIAEAVSGPAHEVSRLRALIRAVVVYRATEPTAPIACPCCWADADPHKPGCPWPALVSEAEKL